ncbi:uncharacterized protein BDZ99DRAFT_466831 [Mytilinidion resinicola]|uniref:Uncharacterized protein n=1 Tax=Mytilinidion resinicola TaxID=574789 RepID=A0A6A6Y964_9PEZI|nr:uncharacterized protein BDZ99DRAFT_466831 [Mytilinidion resinicola]KAF2805179.1 hypothetical protein BDZ99DRAFT_466831 [Mytilinidion resinicola]
MAPRPISAPAKKKGLPKPGPRATPVVKKPIQTSSTRTSLRSQNKLPVSHAGQSHPVQLSPTSPAPALQPAGTKRKHSRDTEAEADKPKDERPSKQSRRSTRHRLKPSEEKLPKDAEAEAEAKADKPEGSSEQPQEPPLLSEKDSRSLQSVFQEVMTSAASNSLKRPASHRSRAPSETGTSSTNTNAVYRRKNLAAVKIRLHANPPDDVETTIKGIVNTKSPRQRQAELHVIAQGFRDGCLKNVRAQSGEDDFLAPLYKTISALCLDNLCGRLPLALLRWNRGIVNL